MKKLILSAVLVVVATAGAMAQEVRGFYLKPTGSYFIKVTPVEFPNVGELQPRDRVFNINPLTGAQTLLSEETITGSFGQGWRAGLTGGFRFSPVVAFEMGINYFQSERQTMARQTGYNQNNGNTLLSVHSSGQAKALDLTPTLVFHVPTSSNFRPYLKIGAVLPVYGYLDIKTTLNDQTGTIASEINPALRAVQLTREERIEPRPTIGFLGAAGFSVPISAKVSFFSEIEYRNVSVSSKEKEVKKFEGTGTTLLGTQVPITINDLPTAQRYTDYHKKIDQNSNVPGNANYDPNKRGDDLRSYINIGGLGMNVGLKLAF
ncbi:outer membrane beta-barrel protein [Pedobacter xixiisoli]|uniref:Outer membrane protein beta-barrel domain-containing protein n=1 Tax=Pedobacter xixiisoli TaxID=1476464 RepID=A0A286A807_9SPHI|nr:outer membrane beta-barrel protein [Pedobacter xixiisoli]SOD18050.1 Outer membrane protein beta-barrel domain-containing protein [Pedobacter xixiisoli]